MVNAIRRAPISATHELFLAHLDGMVYGQRAANGLFEGRTFLHPDMNFLVQFPETWQHENTPQKLVSAAQTRVAEIAQEVVGLS